MFVNVHMPQQYCLKRIRFPYRKARLLQTVCLRVVNRIVTGRKHTVSDVQTYGFRCANVVFSIRKQPDAFYEKESSDTRVTYRS